MTATGEKTNRWCVNYRIKGENTKDDPYFFSGDGDRYIKNLKVNKDYIFEVVLSRKNGGVITCNPEVVNSGRCGQVLFSTSGKYQRILPSN